MEVWSSAAAEIVVSSHVFVLHVLLLMYFYLCTSTTYEPLTAARNMHIILGDRQAVQ